VPNPINKTIVALTGEIGCGKGLVAEYLVKKYEADSFRFSECLKDILDRLYKEKNRENLQELATLLRQRFSDDILSSVMYNDVQNSKSNVVVIDGVRRESDIAFFKKTKGFYLIFVDADIKVRYKRLFARGEKADDKTKTFKEFEQDHKREAESQIKALKNISHKVFSNNSSKDHLYKQIDSFFSSIK
jgi:dephospho-CoA kinase